MFNYNTLERVAAFEAHSDYVRCIAVHPAQPFILVKNLSLGAVGRIAQWALGSILSIPKNFSLGWCRYLFAALLRTVKG